MRILVKVARNANGIPPKYHRLCSQPMKTTKSMPTPDHGAVAAFGGLRLVGRRVVGLDHSCPHFGQVGHYCKGIPTTTAPCTPTSGDASKCKPSPTETFEESQRRTREEGKGGRDTYEDTGVVVVTAVNTIPIVSERQMRFLLSGLAVDSIELAAEHNSKSEAYSAVSQQQTVKKSLGVRKRSSFADLVEEYVSGSLIAADLAAACHSYDSESQRVLLNADVDYRAHFAALHLLQRRPTALFPPPSRDDRERNGHSAAVIVALVCGLWMGEGSSIGLTSVRESVYGPSVAEFATHCQQLMMVTKTEAEAERREPFDTCRSTSCDRRLCEALDTLSRTMMDESDNLETVQRALIEALHAILPLEEVDVNACKEAVESDTNTSTSRDITHDLESEGVKKQRLTSRAFTLDNHRMILVRPSEAVDWPVLEGLASTAGSISTPSEGLVCVLNRVH